MLKKSIPLILVLVILILCISTKSFSAEEEKSTQTSSKNDGSIENQVFITQGKMLSENELNHYYQLQEQAIQNSALNQQGGSNDAAATVLYIALIVLICVPIVIAISDM